MTKSVRMAERIARILLLLTVAVAASHPATAACGDGVVDPGEQCDDGDGDDDDGCTNSCTFAEDLLYDQTDRPSGFGIFAIDFQAADGFYMFYSCEGADDFIVSHPTGWDVERVITPGIGSSSPFFAPAGVNIAFYADLGGLPADVPQCQFTDIKAFGYDAGEVDVALPQVCSLGPGKWWLAHQIIQTQSDTAPIRRWFSSSNQSGEGAVWRNPPGGFADGCIDWTPLPLCAANSGHPDLLFQIFGGKGSGQLVPAIGPYGAVLMVLSIAGAASYILAVRRRRVVGRR